MSNVPRPAAPQFLLTNEYWRFVEFCNACRHHRYIGLCYGLPGVGKTLSARYYARADLLQPWIPHYVTAESPHATSSACRTVVYTPPVANSPRQILQEVSRLRTMMRCHLHEPPCVPGPTPSGAPTLPDLIIVDEADRLKMAGLEQLRDLYDRKHLGLVLMGMPGLEKRMARYAQLYSRIGFVHLVRPLATMELQRVIEHKWTQLGIPFRPTEAADAEAFAAIVRTTSGNFRLLERLFTQIERLLAINDLRVLTTAVIDAARESLVIGAQ